MDSTFRSAIEHQIAADKSFMTAEQIGNAVAFMRDASVNVTSDASNFLASRLEQTGELDSFLRADPVTQKQMAYDIAREYARGSLGTNGLHVPRSILERPSTPADILGLTPNLSERFKVSPIPAQIVDPGSAHTRHAAKVSSRQKAHGVDMSQSINSDAAEEAEHREANANEALAGRKHEVTESVRRQKDLYRDRTTEEIRSTLTGGGIRPDVVREVTRPNRSASGKVSEEN
jgi:hypothetical protein